MAQLFQWTRSDTTGNDTIACLTEINTFTNMIPTNLVILKSHGAQNNHVEVDQLVILIQSSEPGVSEQHGC